MKDNNPVLIMPANVRFEESFQNIQNLNGLKKH